MTRIVLVTGASSGFGAMSAKALAAAGNTVFASMRAIEGRNAGVAAAYRDQAKKEGVDIRPLELDVQSELSVQEAVERVISAEGRVDVVVHNAGHMVFGPSEAFTADQFAELYDINVLGTQRLNRAVLPHMRAARRGLLLWVSSSSARGGTPPYLGPYFAAKAAMDSLAVTYAGELARWGIETSILVPGSFTKGTNHYAHAGRPADSNTLAAYDNGPYRGLEDQLLERMASLEPADADASTVARAIASIVSMPDGTRPFRATVDPSDDGAAVVNAMADRVRAELLWRIGLEDILRPARD
ncbi:SDR family oxidoreductase [Cupriavidus plantarum]|uniref:SDR family oxidoreductase n=1 Tax=Cupriavidus plantarum TaxID=942865 RepID=UPI00339D9F7C